MKTDATQPDEVLDVFEGTLHLVSEIGDALQDARWAAMKIGGECVTHSLEGMASAHIELEKLLGQSRLLSESLGRVIAFHRARQK